MQEPENILIENNIPVKKILRRPSKMNDSNSQPRKNVSFTVTPPEADVIQARPTDDNQDGGELTKRKSSRKKKPLTSKPTTIDTDSEEETFSCEYCITDFHLSVLECEKCRRWGCPECTKLPPEIHTMCCKWGLHFYCTTCEPAVANFCKLSNTVTDNETPGSSSSTDPGEVQERYRAREYDVITGRKDEKYDQH